MTTAQQTQDRLLDCGAYYVNCDFHRSLVEMLAASRKRDVDTYLRAKETALRAASIREHLFPLSKKARERQVQERVDLVNRAHEKFDRRFRDVENGIIQSYVNPDATDQGLSPDSENFRKVLTEVYQEQSAFDSIYIEEAYQNPGFGAEAQMLHVFGEPVDADLSEFTPVNAVHDYVMRQMVEAVIDQRNIVSVDRGLIPDPADEVAKRTGKPITKINGHRAQDDFPDDYPEDLRESANATLDANAEDYEKVFNEGWLYAFYYAVQVVKNAELFANYAEDSAAARRQALNTILQMQYAHWDAQWSLMGEPEGIPQRQKAFFDGAVTAWDRWLEDF